MDEIHIDSVEHARALGILNNPEYYVARHHIFTGYTSRFEGIIVDCCHRCCGRRRGLTEVYCEGGQHLMAAPKEHLFYAQATDGNGVLYEVTAEPMPVTYTFESLRGVVDASYCDKRCGRRLVSEVNTDILCGLPGCMKPVRRRPIS